MITSRREMHVFAHRSQIGDTADKGWGLAATVDQVDPRIRMALEFLEGFTGAELHEVASKLNLSDSRLRHLFKKELGIPPSHYLALSRLARAKTLLENSLLRVKEVATLVGAGDISHFVRSYKILYGVTPSQTRNVSLEGRFRKDLWE
jgi:transcriptional regulator GlxA family with amidase domain